MGGIAELIVANPVPRQTDEARDVDFDITELSTELRQRVTQTDLDDRSNYDWGTAKELMRHGLSDAEIVSIAQQCPDGFGAKLADPKHGRKYIFDTITNARHDLARDSDTQDPHPPGRRAAAVVQKFEPLTARELCRLEAAQHAELLGPLVVAGNRTVVGGRTGEGKTTLMLSMVAAVVTGGDFLGWHATDPLRVLYIDAEQGLRTVQRRLREAGVSDSTGLEYLRVPDGLTLDQDQAQVDALEEVVAGGFDVVVAEPIYKLHRGDSSDERPVVDLMIVLDRWRERYDFGLILGQHARKRLDRSCLQLDDLFGSSAYTRGAEVVLSIERIRDGYGHMHVLKDRDGDLPIGERYGLMFDRENGFRLDPDDRRQRPSAVTKVADYLDTSGEATISQIERGTGVSEKTVRRALEDLRARVVATGPHGRKVYAARVDTDPTQVGHD